MQVLKTLYSCNTNSSFRSEINSIFVKIVLIIKTNTIDLQDQLVSSSFQVLKTSRSLLQMYVKNEIA